MENVVKNYLTDNNNTNMYGDYIILTSRSANTSVYSLDLSIWSNGRIWLQLKGIPISLIYTVLVKEN